MILELKILENRTGNTQTYKELQKSRMNKKDQHSKIKRLVRKNQQLLIASNRKYTINKTNHTKIYLERNLKNVYSLHGGNKKNFLRVLGKRGLKQNSMLCIFMTNRCCKTVNFL